MRSPLASASNPHYIFFDLETSGLSHTHDQILQFAAIITDINLNTIKKINLRIKLRPDIIPSPKALLVTRTSPEVLLNGTSDNPALCEHDAIQQIYEIINTPNTINLGYNSIHFDDQFLRFSFFRNLLPPYKHQWDNHCHRMDIYPAILFTHHFYPQMLKWPEINGKPSFKLEHLVKQNNLSSGISHDALVDVSDTIELTRVLSNNPDLWQEITAFFDKASDKRRINNAPSPLIINNAPFEIGFMMDSHPNEPIMPVICLGQHDEYKNQTKWLRLDKIAFEQSNLDKIEFQKIILTKKYGEPPFFFPCNDERCTSKFSTDQQDFVLDNINWISNNAIAFSKICQNARLHAHQNTLNTDPFASLYQLGFPNQSQEALFEKFRTIEVERKLEVALKFKEKNYKELAIRILGSTYPDTLKDTPTDSDEVLISKKEARDIYQHFINSVYTEDKIYDYRGQTKRTISEAIREAKSEIAALNESNNTASQEFLAKLLDWYQKQFLPLCQTHNSQTVPQNVVQLHQRVSMFARRYHEREESESEQLFFCSMKYGEK